MYESLGPMISRGTSRKISGRAIYVYKKLKKYQANNWKLSEPIVYDVQDHPLVYHLNGDPIALEYSTISHSILGDSVQFKAIKDAYAFAFGKYNNSWNMMTILYSCWSNNSL